MDQNVASATIPTANIRRRATDRVDSADRGQQQLIARATLHQKRSIAKNTMAKMIGNSTIA